MRPARLDALLAALEDAEGPRTRSLCRAVAQAVGVSGAGLTLLIGDSAGPLCASDAVSARIEELQYTLRQGPCVDSHQTGRPVSEPDLATPSRSRWPAFSAEALGAGAAAIFAFPLRVGAVRLGALTLYQAAPGPLDQDQFAGALAMAEVAVHEVLVAQSHAPAGAVADELAALSVYRAEVHQAAGMVAVQLGAEIAEAMVRLRAHAFANDRTLAEVAADVVNRRLRIEP